MVKISKRAPGLSAEKLAATLKKIGACPSARRATRGKTLAEAWRSSRRGGNLAYWLYHTTPAYDVVQIRRTVGAHYFFLNNSTAVERKYANAIRAAYHWDGSRKDVAANG